MEREIFLAFVPCDQHPIQEAVVLDVDSNGFVQFKCIECKMQEWDIKSGNRDRWKLLIKKGVA